MEVPDGDYATVAGLLLWHLGHIPVAGEEVGLPGYRAIVLGHGRVLHRPDPAGARRRTAGEGPRGAARPEAPGGGPGAGARVVRPPDPAPAGSPNERRHRPARLADMSDAAGPDCARRRPPTAPPPAPPSRSSGPRPARGWPSGWSPSRRPRSCAGASAPTPSAVFHNVSQDDMRALVDEGRRWMQEKATVGYHAVTWDTRYGGMGLSPLHERAYREEESRFRGPLIHEAIAITRELIAPTIRAHGTDDQRDRFLARDAVHRGDVVPALLGAGRRLRPGGPRHPGGAGRRRVGHRRPEGLDLGRAVRRVGLHPVPHRPERGQAPGHHRLPGADGTPTA